MKQRLLFFFPFLMFVAVNKLNAADIEINVTNFPDANFRSYLLEQEYGKDGVITDSEIQNITSIKVSYKAISSLKGVEYFTALIELACSNNQLTTLDVSNCTALITLYCNGNQLTTLDVSSCTALTSLYCNGSQLTSLDVSNCTELINLGCSNNQLTSLDVSNCTELIKLSCSNNQLTSLDVSNCKALTGLYCSSNQLTSLDVSNCTALTWLECNANQLATLDVSKNTALTSINCSRNKINGVNMDDLINSLPKNETGKTKSFYVRDNVYDDEMNICTKSQVAAAKSRGWTPRYLYYGDEWEEYEGGDTHEGKAVNETTFPDENFRNYIMNRFFCYQSGVLDYSDIKRTTTMEVYSMNISSLKGIEFFTELTTLSCYWNNLTSLDVSKNTALTSLGCDCNQLTSLNVSNCTALTSLDCRDNQLTSLDVSSCTALTSLLCNSNQLTSLDVSNCTALTKLLCYRNKISGKNMDDLINSLPQNNTGEIYRFEVISKSQEGNVITKRQVAAAKAKGWTPYCYDESTYSYTEYEGSDDEQINDLTALVGVSAEDWNADGMVGWAGPEVTTRDGRTTALAECYHESADVTGTVMEQTVTGLENGEYRVTLYANACYTPGRDFDSDIYDGQMDLVYLFANSTKQYIPALIATSVSEHGEYTLTTTVNDGMLHLGMVAEKPGTNWYSIQIKSLDRIETPIDDITTDISALDNVIYMDATEVRASSKATLSLKMKNSEQICAFQFDLCLPEGVTVAKNSKDIIQGALSNDRLYEGDNHTLSIRELEDGVIRVVCTSSSNLNFIGNEGEIATLKVNIADDMTVGDYAIRLKDIKLVKDNGDKLYTELVQSKLTVVSYIPGDANGDGEVDVADVVAIVNYILEKPAENFNFKAADVNGDNEIDAADVVLVVNIILDKGDIDTSRVREVLRGNGFIF